MIVLPFLIATADKAVVARDKEEVKVIAQVDRLRW